MPGIQRKKYETDNGSIFNVLLDENTGINDLVGNEPGGSYTENMTVNGSKNNKESGITPRKVLLSRKINANAQDSNCLVQSAERYKRVPIPTKARWDAIVLNSKYTIGGVEYEVKKKLQEKIA